jgi:predicted metal-dependent HD superfamily phosphohydrolase
VRCDVNPIDLAQRWKGDMYALGAKAIVPESIFKMIIDNYTHPSRHYHNLDHLRALFFLLESHSPQPPSIISRLAVWWHDVIYDPLSGDNETNSANLAKIHLSEIGASPGVIDQVCALIMATKSHFTSASFGEDDAFLDADIAILGAPEAIYRRYALSVRAEYSMLPTLLFNQGRLAFLNKALTLPRLFKTDVFEDTYAVTARLNMKNEVTELMTVKNSPKA